MQLPTPAPVPALLGVHDLRFRWPKARHDLLHLRALEIAPGERVFLQGASGSGKSSLLALLGGVSRPQTGTVTLLGHTISALPQKRVDTLRADHIGFVFQMFNLVPYLSAQQNVVLPCRFSASRRQRIRQAGTTVDAEARRLLSALELAEEDRAVTDLSIGQQQRVAVARALIGAPELLIADEPTSALDEGTRERFLELLFSECAARHTAVLLVSHDARMGQLFDRQLHLGDLNQAAKVRT